MKKERYNERNPKVVIEFDGEKYSKEEQEYLIFRFVQVLQRLDKKQKGDELLCS